MANHEVRERLPETFHLEGEIDHEKGQPRDGEHEIDIEYANDDQALLVTVNDAVDDPFHGKQDDFTVFLV